MKVIILQNKLREGLESVSRITGKVFHLPILANVLVEAEKNLLCLSTTNLEIGIRSWVLAKVDEPGSLCIPTSLFLNLVNFLKEGPVKLTSENTALILETAGYQSRLVGQETTDFPLFPQEKGAVCVTLPQSLLSHALDLVVDIPQISTARPEISGVYFLFQRDLIKITATDSYRLAEKTLFFKKPLDLEENYSLILPQKTAKDVVGLFGLKEGRGKVGAADSRGIKIFLGTNQVLFESQMAETSHPQLQLVSRLIEGEYPNYQEIIPQKFDTQVVLNRDNFLNHIKLASLFSGKINEVRLKIVPKKEAVEICSHDTEAGRHQSFLPGKIKGAEKEISFNYRFLLDGLMKIKSSEVIFELTARNGEPGPGVLKPALDPSFIYVLMPMQTG